MTFIFFIVIVRFYVFIRPYESIPGAKDFILHPPSSSSSSSTSNNNNNNEWPRKIWQTWKEHIDNGDTRSWCDNNPDYTYTLLTDEEALSFVREHFSRQEDEPLRRTYEDLNDPVLRADLFRYLVLYAEGGVYSDIDTIDLKPISTWPTSSLPSSSSSLPSSSSPLSLSSSGLVLGVEIDVPYPSKEDRRKWGWKLPSSTFQLIQWTMMSKPHHPAMALVIQRIVRAFSAFVEREHVSLKDMRRLSTEEVIITTGPYAFTRIIEEYLSTTLHSHVDWRNMTGLQGPKQLGDITILPVTAFGPGQRHSGSQGTDHPQALSFHKFGASKWGQSRSKWNWLRLVGV
eukprot:TRINITY_DN8926_c0_g1_i2.p1 TRINITY_DN8926_c0_g1~~TRINITY_DN8926_c0_g1_i2.p1  ORF type:complete len:365 (+),score=69.67 TRINITY_DN8926_c0_g1_i2:67-1095(+)